MKFGHDLAKVISVSDPEWAPFFIQYKLLKKCIKVIDSCCDDSVAAPRSLKLATMAHSAPEVAFFRTLRGELRKTSRFFKTTEQVLEIRRERIAEALRQLGHAARRESGTKSVLLEDSDEMALSACVAYYRDLLLLENYAIINFCGFSKILKKHDKRTGYETRARFMRVCVAPQPFTHYPRLLEMIKEAEGLYHQLAQAATKSRRNSTTNNSFLEPGSTIVATPMEESDIIEAILNLRCEAVSLRAAEETTTAAAENKKKSCFLNRQSCALALARDKFSPLAATAACPPPSSCGEEAAPPKPAKRLRTDD